METTTTAILDMANTVNPVTIPDMLVPMVGTIMTAIGGAVLYILKRLADYAISKMQASDEEKQVVSHIMDAVVEAEHELVLKFKQAAADGKLTKDEIETIQSYVVERVKATASGPVLELLTKYGERRIRAIIQQLVLRIKG